MKVMDYANTKRKNIIIIIQKLCELKSLYENDEQWHKACF